MINFKEILELRCSCSRIEMITLVRKKTMSVVSAELAEKTAKFPVSGQEVAIPTSRETDHSGKNFVVFF